MSGLSPDRYIRKSKLRDLVEEWRDMAEVIDDGTIGNVACHQLHDCADELESVIGSETDE